MSEILTYQTYSNPNLPTIIFSVLFAVVYVLRTIHYTHMFQLNSYKPKVQLKWLKNNMGAFIKNSLPLIFLTVFSFFIPMLYDLLLIASSEDPNGFVCGTISYHFWVIDIVFVVGLIIAIVLNLPKKAKKPLVYTNRVKRLLVTCALVFVLLCCLLRWVNYSNGLQPFLLMLVLIASPLLLLLCNLINKPIELSINRYYINDAKKMLKEHSNLTVIGVTGSYGKTSVKYILGTLLEAKYNVLITPESFNTPLGVTKTVRSSLRATHDIFVCEMGAKNVGDIKEICDIVYPQHGIITSVGPQHLESFKSLDNVKKTKFELADALPAYGKLFLNGEDENIKAVSHPHDAITYGLNDSCDYYADEITVTSAGTSFVVKHGDEAVPFTVALIGAHNVINIVGAIAICCEMGIELKKLPPYARKIKAVEHRLQLTKRGKTTVVDDAYNSNPSGAKAALDAISLFQGKKIIVTPGMIELGSVQFEENRKFGENIAKVCDFAVLVGKKQAEPINKGLLDAGFPAEKIYIANDLTDAANKAFSLFPDEEKVVLFENDLPDNY